MSKPSQFSICHPTEKVVSDINIISNRPNQEMTRCILKQLPTSGVSPPHLLYNNPLPTQPAKADPEALTPSRRYIQDVSVLDVINSVTKNNNDDAFDVVDVGNVQRRLDFWKEHMPSVKPYYAVKSFPDATVVATMTSLEMSFDCASPLEVDLVLATGAKPDQIIYANPSKQPSHITLAYAQGVNLTTFDNKSELDKIHQLAPGMELVLRIKPDDSKSKIPLGSKFGAVVGQETQELLDYAKELNLNVVGVSFHVGSNCVAYEPYVDAIELSKEVFAYGIEKGYAMAILDIGGGFPGAENDNEFIEMARQITNALQNFPVPVQVIAEPGRYFSAPLMTSVASISTKRKVGEQREYFINQSAFGVFAEGLLPQDRTYDPKVFPRPQGSATYPAKIWGPTCASQDVINTPANLQLPELEVGNWIYFENMGAYSVAFGFSL
ncbi:hypothetical protein DSO57_1006621 [Entomophthora muscae]|uniref:Uncharacterized protein n=1 Tax=Entomophthora muscae TaxID=34485 RepID=A0ACC2T7X9_9FUNG|nr:hypothetical protein DSO57_1006621 [Entomophthora muscae]